MFTDKGNRDYESKKTEIYETFVEVFGEEPMNNISGGVIEV